MSDDVLVNLVREVAAAYRDGVAEGERRAASRLAAALRREDELLAAVDEAHVEIERLREALASARRAS